MSRNDADSESFHRKIFVPVRLLYAQFRRRRDAFIDRLKHEPVKRADLEAQSRTPSMIIFAAVRGCVRYYNRARCRPRHARLCDRLGGLAMKNTIIRNWIVAIVVVSLSVAALVVLSGLFRTSLQPAGVSGRSERMQAPDPRGRELALSPETAWLPDAG